MNSILAIILTIGLFWLLMEGAWWAFPLLFILAIAISMIYSNAYN